MSYRYGQSAAYGASGRKGPAAALPLWTPANAGAAVAGWFDATDSATLTLNGAKIAAWANKGSAGSALIQATASIQPGYSATGWDGALPCLTGDGLDSGTVIGAAIAGLAGNFWIFAVAERGTQSDTNSGTSFRPVIVSTDAGGARAFFGPQRPTGDPTQSFLYAQAGSGASAAASPWTSTAKALLFTDLRTTVQVGLNGAAPAGAGTHGVTDMFSDFCIFGDSRVSTTAQRGRHFAGKVFEVLVVDPAQLPGGGSAVERQRFEGYAAWRAHIQTALPGSHPYRYFAPHL
jgi:hypothetical protein